MIKNLQKNNIEFHKKNNKKRKNQFDYRELKMQKLQHFQNRRPKKKFGNLKLLSSAKNHQKIQKKNKQKKKNLPEVLAESRMETF